MDINKFVLDPEISSPYWLVRKATVFSHLLWRSPTCRDNELENRKLRRAKFDYIFHVKKPTKMI